MVDDESVGQVIWQAASLGRRAHQYLADRSVKVVDVCLDLERTLFEVRPHTTDIVPFVE